LHVDLAGAGAFGFVFDGFCHDVLSPSF
jgi:hypothetical protein